MSDGRARVVLLAGQLGRGGAEAQLVELACGLDRSRFDPTIVLLRNRNDHAERLAAAGIPVVGLGKSGWWDALVLRRLVGHLRQKRPHVLHSTLFHANLVAALVARRAGVGALVLSQRGSYERNLPLPVPELWRRLARWSASRADVLVVNSEATAREERAAGVPAGRIVVIPNGVAVPESAFPSRAAMDLPSVPIVLAVGRLEPVKGHHHLLEAWPRVRALRPTAILMIIGAGAERRALQAQAERLGLGDGVRWLGERPALPYIANADVLVQPSLSEGMPNVVLEAMALGVPVVASSVGGTTELIANGETGLLVPAADAGALAEAISRLLEDRTTARRLAEAGQRRARERNSLRAMVAATEAVYRGLIDSVPAGTRRVLVFGQRPYPTDHAALESLFARELPRRRWQPVWILPPADASVAGGCLVWNGTAVRVTPERRWPGPLRHLELLRSYLRAGERILSTSPVDLVHARTGLPEAIAAWWLARRHRRPFVFQRSFLVALSRRTYLEGRGWPTLARLVAGIEGRLRDAIERRADLILAISDEMARERRGGSPRVEVLPLGADVSIQPETIAPVEAPPLSVIYFGSMDAKRRLDFLLRVFARVVEQVGNAHLLMLGDAAGSGLQEIAQSMGLGGRVSFLGRVPRRDVPRYLRAARCSVAAIPPMRLYEVSSTTKVVESLAMAVPVVANREIPDQRELVEGSGGGYCPAYDEEAVAEAVIALLDDPVDAARRGEAGRRYVVRHRSYAVLAERLAGWYDETLSAAVASGP
jgi:L-malate glycosyltransferase